MILTMNTIIIPSHDYLHENESIFIEISVFKISRSNPMNPRKAEYDYIIQLMPRKNIPSHVTTLEEDVHDFLSDGQPGLRMLVNNAGFKVDQRWTNGE